MNEKSRFQVSLVHHLCNNICICIYNTLKRLETPHHPLMYTPEGSRTEDEAPLRS